ncbi:winged-helix domain-containing protein [Shewanella sp.]|uniref:winged helix-turn-helix transcriptional regulator n=1 Tax=Shewanella sp. TaxID=50422 RepID=UPI003562EEDE
MFKNFWDESCGDIRDLLSAALQRDDVAVRVIDNPADASMPLVNGKSASILLDLLLPNHHSFAQLPAAVSAVPMPIPSATHCKHPSANHIRQSGNSAGTKSAISTEILIHMLVAKRNLPTPTDKSVMVYGSVLFDTSRNTVIFGEAELFLTQTEFNLFCYLYNRRGQVVSKPELQCNVLHKDYGQYDRNLDMHISNTRRKLAAAGLPRNLITTIRGRGYSFVDC